MTLPTGNNSKLLLASIDPASIVKAAKSILQTKNKKDETIKMKSVTKKIAKQLSENNSNNVDEDDLRLHIKKTIIECGEFKLCEKEKTILSVEKKKKRKHDDIVPVVKNKKDDEWRKENKIILLDSGTNRYTPYQTFDDAAKISTLLIRHCTHEKKYKFPSPIQAQCWPVLLDILPNRSVGHDLIGIAETGSGKTLAFALPALSLLSSASSNKRRLPRMLVLAPTRELAMQSHEVLLEFGNCVRLESLVVYGGVSKQPQAMALKKGNVDCIVATPGRLKDFINDGTCHLSNISYLVLDEADRMLDMGFQEDVEYIIRQCPGREQRQTSMFSATWPAAIQQLASEYMVDPVRVYVGFEPIVGSGGTEGDTDNGDAGAHTSGVDDSLSANKRVKQIVEVIEDRARESRLRQLLQEYTSANNNKNATTEGHLEHDRILVFALYKKEAERLENTVRHWGYNVGSINGNKSQEARSKSLASFKDGSCPLLIATDVASRGLDIPNVEVVLNYTFPLTIEDYVHRIGRTGRAGKTGISHTFFQPSDKSHAGELQQVLKQAGQILPDELMKFGSFIKKKEHKLYGAHYGGSNNVPMKQPTRIKFD